MMPNSIQYIFSSLVFVFLIGCDCDETYVCESLSTEQERLLLRGLESHTFTNGADSTIQLEFENYRISQATEHDCKNNTFGGCDCSYCPEKSGQVSYRFSVPFENLDSILVTIDSGSYRGNNYYTKDTSYYNYFSRTYEKYIITITSDNVFKLSFLDFFKDLLLTENLKVDPTSLDEDILVLPEFSTPLRRYESVVELKTDGGTSWRPSIYFKRIYYHFDDGVVAFESKDGTLFYLSN